MTRILAHFYNTAPSDCRSSFVKRDTKQRDSLFQHPELQELQKALQQGRSKRKPEEVQTALRVSRLPFTWVLANGKAPQ